MCFQSKRISFEYDRRSPLSILNILVVHYQLNQVTIKVPLVTVMKMKRNLGHLLKAIGLVGGPKLRILPLKHMLWLTTIKIRSYELCLGGNSVQRLRAHRSALIFVLEQLPTISCMNYDPIINRGCVTSKQKLILNSNEENSTRGKLQFIVTSLS